MRIRLTHRIEERFLRQSISLLTSILIHAVVVLFAMVASTPEADPFRSTRRTAVTQLDTKPRQKLIWIRRGDKLPTVSPGEPGPLRAERNQTKSNQQRRAAPAKARGDKQFVWSDIPKATPQPVVQAADVVSLAAQRAAIAPPPPARETRRFALPAAPRPQAETKLVDDPNLNVQNPASPVSLNAPSAQLAAGPISKPPARTFVAPANAPRASTAGLVEAPEVVAAQNGNGAVNLVVLSQAPGAGLPPPGLGPRPDRVGSVPGTPGAAPGGGGSEGLTVPGVTVRGAAGGTPSRAAPSLPSAQPVDPALARGAAAAANRPVIPAFSATTVSVPQWPHARRVPVEVDRMFPSKPVFAAVIAGAGGGPDWILWFSDKEEIARGTRVLMRPPVLQRRQGVNAGPRIEGLPPRVLIGGSISREGRFLVRSVSPEVSPELARQLVREAAQWTFSAAYRNGLAIEADCLLEMRVSLKR